MQQLIFDMMVPFPDDPDGKYFRIARSGDRLEFIIGYSMHGTVHVVTPTPGQLNAIIRALNDWEGLAR